MTDADFKGFWKAALATGGLGAIGAFVFWSLYNRWLELPIFERMSGDQTFYIMIMFVGLVFLSLIAFLITYLKSKQLDHGQVASSWDAHAPAKIAVVDISVTQEGYTASVDVKLRNPSSSVAYIKSAEARVLEYWAFDMSQAPYAVPVEATYDMMIPAKPGVIVKKSLSQAIPANAVDRFLLRLATDHKQYPYTGLSLFLLHVRLIFNENDLEVDLGRFLVNLPAQMEIHGLTDDGPEREMVKHNKRIATVVLGHIHQGARVDNGLVDAIKSWSEVDLSKIPG